MSTKEIELLVSNLVVLDADSRTVALNIIFYKYGSAVHREVLHKLATALKEQGYVK